MPGEDCIEFTTYCMMHLHSSRYMPQKIMKCLRGGRGRKERRVSQFGVIRTTVMQGVAGLHVRLGKIKLLNKYIVQGKITSIGQNA